MFDIFISFLPIAAISLTLLFPPKSFLARLMILVLSFAFMWAAPQYGPDFEHSSERSSNPNSYAENYPD